MIQLKFKMRSDGAINETFTQAWDHASREYFRKHHFIPSIAYNEIWSETHSGQIIELGGGFYQVEMEEQDYTAFLLRWA